MGDVRVLVFAAAICDDQAVRVLVEQQVLEVSADTLNAMTVDRSAVEHSTYWLHLDATHDQSVTALEDAQAFVNDTKATEVA